MKYIIPIIVLLITLLSCEKENIVQQIDYDQWQLDTNEFKRYVIQEGQHASSPSNFQLLWRNSKVSGYGYFTEKSKYNLHSVDQKDWNKLSGFKFDWGSPPKYAAMIAWRYDTLNDNFQLAPYFNKNGIIFPDEDMILNIEPYQVFRFESKLDGKDATVTIENQYVEFTKTEKLRSVWLYSEVSPWFGGNQNAPSEIELFLKMD